MKYCILIQISYGLMKNNGNLDKQNTSTNMGLWQVGADGSN
jgi:hypothetical protein